MAAKNKPETKPGRKAAETKQPAKPQRGRSRQELVEQAIQQFGQKLEQNELKPTVGDLIRLLQLEKELLEETPKEIKVSWVGTDAKEHVPEK